MSDNDQHILRESEPNDEGLEFDGTHCPSCGSTKIDKYGTTEGEDTGDEGLDYDKWRCNECDDIWLTDQDGA
jgi:transposase-like protein